MALDSMLEQAKAEGVVNPFKFVSDMRLRRPCMIQTMVRYTCGLIKMYHQFSKICMYVIVAWVTPISVDTEFLSDNLVQHKKVLR